MNRAIREITLTNLLSFGPDTEMLELRPLNVLIGPNGSGKSNFLEAIGLLRAAPQDLSAPVKEMGGVEEWLWKGKRNPQAVIATVVHNDNQPSHPLRHVIGFREHGGRFEVTSERIEYEKPFRDHTTPYWLYRNDGGTIRLRERREPPPAKDEGRAIRREVIHPEKSVLSQIKDPDQHPSLSALDRLYGHFHLYREWSFGRYTAPRLSQQADLPTQFLKEECDNLPLVLNALRPPAKTEILAALSDFYPQIDDFYVQIAGGRVQLFLEEGRFSIPATRLSDGTLRFLCLLAILCHPEPPALVCIEEPELGLHPDVLPTLARLLIRASDRCQLVVTTHSDVLVDALTSTPESVIVCEKRDGATRMKRLNESDLKGWLEEYTLGELWRKGELGGNRW